jgi:hypothetical protein
VQQATRRRKTKQMLKMMRRRMTETRQRMALLRGIQGCRVLVLEVCPAAN